MQAVVKDVQFGFTGTRHQASGQIVHSKGYA